MFVETSGYILTAGEYFVVEGDSWLGGVWISFPSGCSLYANSTGAMSSKLYGWRHGWLASTVGRVGGWRIAKRSENMLVSCG